MLATTLVIVEAAIFVAFFDVVVAATRWALDDPEPRRAAAAAIRYWTTKALVQVDQAELRQARVVTHRQRVFALAIATSPLLGRHSFASNLTKVIVAVPLAMGIVSRHVETVASVGIVYFAVVVFATLTAWLLQERIDALCRALGEDPAVFSATVKR